MFYSIKLSGVFLAFIPFVLLGQNTVLKGTINQVDSLTPIAEAHLYVSGTLKGAISDVRGNFSFELPENTKELVVSKIGYQTQVIAVNTLNLNQPISIFLKESIAQLPEISVITQGSPYTREAVGSTQYLAPKELQKFSYTDVSRILATVPGVNVQEEDGFGLRPNIGMRGTGTERSSKITLMEDGVLMAPAPYAASAAYYFPSVGRMQGIEVVKGSSQIKYGPFTTGGAINLISTQIPDQLSAKVSLSAGSFGLRNVHAYVGNMHKNVGYLIETFQLDAAGFKNLANGGNTGFNKADYIAKVLVKTNDSAKVFQSLLFKIGNVSEHSNETYLGLSLADFNADPYRRYAASAMDYMENSHQQFSLTHTVKPSTWMQISTTAYYNEFKRNWYKLNDVTDTSGTKYGIASVLASPENHASAYAILQGEESGVGALLVKANDRSYYSKGIQSNMRMDFTTNQIKHRVDVGVRVHQDQMDRFQRSDNYQMLNGSMLLSSRGVDGKESNQVETANAASGYIQYELTYNKLRLVPGIRYEYADIERLDYGKNDVERTGSALISRSNINQAFVPGVGVHYSHSKFLSSFVGVHKGFAPSGSAAETLPEQSTNYEIGMRYQKTVLNTNITLFYNDYTNLLGSDLAASGGAGTADLFNGGKALTQGIEASLGYAFVPSGSKHLYFPIQVSYTFTQATFKNTFESTFESWGDVNSGDALPYLAPHQLQGQIGVEGKVLKAFVNVRYQDQMRAVAGIGAIDAQNLIPSFTVVDLSVQGVINPVFTVFSSIQNVGNKAYAVSNNPAGFRPGMPRTFILGLRAQF